MHAQVKMYLIIDVQTVIDSSIKLTLRNVGNKIHAVSHIIFTCVSKTIIPIAFFRTNHMDYVSKLFQSQRPRKNAKD